MEPRPRDTRTDRLSPEGLATGRALVIEPVVRKAAARAAPFERDPAARLDEAVGLARAIDLDVADSGIVMLAAVLAVTVAACTGPKYERNAIFDNNCSHHSFLPPGDGFCEKYTAGK